jgi:ribosomal protein L7/L12
MKMADLAKIVEDLSSLTVLEAAELSKMLEEKWGVSAAAPVAVAAAGGAAAPAAAEEEKTEFDVILTDAAPTRSTSSRKSVASPASASRKPRTSSKALRRLSRKRFQG